MQLFISDTISFADPEFAQCAEKALFLLLERDKENISATDTSKICKFLMDFVHRCRCSKCQQNIKKLLSKVAHNPT